MSKLGNFLKSMTQIVGSGLDGSNIYVDNDTRVDRLQTCSGCKWLGDKGKCKLCGCPVESKVLYKEAKCPKKKW